MALYLLRTEALGGVYLWWVQKYSVFEFAHEWCDYNLHVSVAFN